MAETTEKRVIMPTDMLYLFTFAAGMAAFWAGGHAAKYLPVFKNSALSIAAGLIITAGIFALLMALISFIVTRSLKSVLAATVISVGLGLAAAQVITRLANGHIHNRTDITILTFVLYLCYGGIY